MATFDKKIKIGFNRLLDRTALREHWLEFFESKLSETVAAMFQGKSGTLDEDVVGLDSSANDTFNLDMTNARKVVVGSGNVITLPTNANRATKEHVAVPFANVTATIYEVGIRYQEVAGGVQINGRTGQPEYPDEREDMGEKGPPDLVTDTPGVSVALRINTLTQTSVDHSGRKAIVYLAEPVSGVESVAFYEGVVAYNGGQNEVVIPYSGGNGPLGQDTSVNPPSTTVGDYVVYLPGASWKAGTGTIYGDNDYAFIGRITGNGPAATPSVFNTSDQRAVYVFDLDSAYDGIGSGAGRIVTVDGGSVDFRSGATVGDRHQSILRLDKLVDSEAGGLCLEALTHLDAQQGVLAIHLLHTGVGTTHPSTIGTLQFTDSTDLDAIGFNNTTDLVIVSGTLTSDGLYRASGVVQAGPSPAAEIAVLQLDGTGAGVGEWAVSETGTIHIVRPVLQAGGGDTQTLPLSQAGTRGNVSMVATGALAALSLHPGNSGRCLDVLVGGGADNTPSARVSSFNDLGYLEVYDGSGVLRARHEATLGRLIQRVLRLQDIATSGGQEFDFTVPAGVAPKGLHLDNASATRNKIMELLNDSATTSVLLFHPRGSGNAIQSPDEFQLQLGENSADRAMVRMIKNAAPAKSFQIIIGAESGGQLVITVTATGATMSLGAKTGLHQWLNLEAIKGEFPSGSNEWRFNAKGVFPATYVVGYHAFSTANNKILRLFSNDLPKDARIDSIDIDWDHQGGTLGDARILKFRWSGSSVSTIQLNSGSSVLVPSNGSGARGIDQFTVNQNDQFLAATDKLFFEIKCSGDVGQVDTWVHGIRANYHTTGGIGTKHY